MSIVDNVAEDRGLSVNQAIDLIRSELQRAWQLFPRPSASAHEAWAVLYEEVDELWDEVKSNNREKQRLEAVQVAAMAIRFLVET